MSTLHRARAPREVDRRSWPRYGLGGAEPFTLTADGRIHACRIVDISLGGARLRLDGEMPRNLELRIEHRWLGHAYARTCWKGSHDMGVSFDHSPRTLAFIARCLDGTREPAHAYSGSRSPGPTPQARANT